MKKPRHLSPDERALWETVAQQAAPLHKSPQKVERPSVQRPKVDATTGLKSIPSFSVGQKVDHSGRNDLAPTLAQQMKAAPVQMDHKAFGRMKRGKLKPEARIDLHGMTLAQAHPALIGFILRSASAGHRLVLVITGKGKDRDEGGPIPTKHGVLRHQVPQWLSMAPLAPLVLQVSQSHIRHGGGGAYYVYLRRAR